MGDITSGAREIGVTIKYGKGYDETWATFRGNADEIRADILAYFGMADTEGLSLNGVVINATKLAHGGAVVASQLGGTAIPTTEPAGDWDSAGSGQAAAPAEPERNPLFARIEAATSTDELTTIWAENQTSFAPDSELMAAWKARGRALQS